MVVLKPVEALWGQKKSEFSFKLSYVITKYFLLTFQLLLFEHQEKIAYEIAEV
jgi:hypothetical protein